MNAWRRPPATYSIPARAGIGLKPDHYEQILDRGVEIGWFEVHAENYMEAGGAPHRFLTAIRERYPLSVHGVGMSIGGAASVDTEHLMRLRSVCERYEPGLVSEHLAWSTHDGVFFNDLLPLPYNGETLARVCEHIDQIQDVLARKILLENPSTYIQFDNSDRTEIEFLREVVLRTGCGLLLDVNNVFVCATNHSFDPAAYIDHFPIEHAGEIHLGGHARDQDDAGSELLIDAHGTSVSDPVWALYARALTRAGPVPTLIEWDNEIPTLDVLHEEARRAERILQRAGLPHDERAA